MNVLPAPSGRHHTASLATAKQGFGLGRPKCARRHVTQRTAVIAAADEGSRGGLRLLEWTGKLVPQGLLVKGAKAGWHMLWQTFMQELAPQSKDGEYVRPSYGLRGTIGSEEFPVCSPASLQTIRIPYLATKHNHPDKFPLSHVQPCDGPVLQFNKHFVRAAKQLILCTSLRDAFPSLGELASGVPCYRLDIEKTFRYNDVSLCRTECRFLCNDL